MWVLRDLVHKILQFFRLLRSQNQSTNSYRCFSCPTYFGSLASLSDHQELHFKLPSTSVSFNKVCDRTDFSTEAVNSKIRIHRLKLDNCGVLQPFNYLVSQKESVVRFVDDLLKSKPNLKLGLTICVKLEKPLENETVEALFNSPMARSSCKISDDEYIFNIWIL